MTARIPISGIMFGIAGLVVGDASALNNCLEADFVETRAIDHRCCN